MDRSAGPLLVKYQGKEYDIGKFAARHPGGAQLLENAEGMEIEEYLKGGEEMDGFKHEHSVNAYRILQKYALDENEPSGLDVDDSDIDYDKPIVWQVGKLGHRYWDWIHRPVDKDLRMFQSDFIEYFSRTHWAAIPAIWLPVSAILLNYGSKELSANGWEGYPKLFALLGMFCLGVTWWTQLEYGLHRFAFHWRPNPESPRQITAHFFLHGLHHKTPMDRGRLVFPPPVGGIFVLIAVYIHASVLPWALAMGVSSGTLFGYTCYDLIHYYLHHGNPHPGSYPHSLKHYHHNHHFKNPDLSYGITSKLWDVPFGTVGAA